jgi:hypothetical protein
MVRASVGAKERPAAAERRWWLRLCPGWWAGQLRRRLHRDTLLAVLVRVATGQHSRGEAGV